MNKKDHRNQLLFYLKRYNRNGPNRGSGQTVMPKRSGTWCSYRFVGCHPLHLDYTYISGSSITSIYSKRSYFETAIHKK